MWKYQQYFRVIVERRAESVLENLFIAKPKAKCLLVGVKIPNHNNPNDVCVEPEDGKWSISLFTDLPETVETEVIEHPWQNIFYGDEPRMQEKPEHIRCDSVVRAVKKALLPYDQDHGTCSFVGATVPINDHYVVPVLQIAMELFEQFPSLHLPLSDDSPATSSAYASLIHSAVSEVLSEAHDELERPDPGRYFSRMRSPAEIIRRAATQFMFEVTIAAGVSRMPRADLFERFNLISSLMYEGAKGTGRMLLTKPESCSVNMSIKFAEPVPFQKSRWSRKVLQMASSETALIADDEHIFGIGNIASGMNLKERCDVIGIEFFDHYHWRLLHRDNILLISKFGGPSLPQEKFPHDAIFDTYQRLFPHVETEDINHFFSIIRVAADQSHGSMLVVAQDAQREADRLQRQGTRIEPTKLTPDLYRQVSSIDGAVIVDPHGICHAIGVILDGSVRPGCTPSRGSRYNSGLRYVGGNPRLAVVVSDDKTIDVIPEPRLRIKKTVIYDAIEKLETAPLQDYYPIFSWLDKHRFYLNQEMCNRVNTAFVRIQNELEHAGDLVIGSPNFSQNPDLDESYYSSED